MSSQASVDITAPRSLTGESPNLSTFVALVRAIRLRQWTKNILVFFPLLTAHLVLEPQAALDSLLAFVAFSFCASAAYIINDLVDLESDRQHATKRNRPFASGRLPVRTGWTLIPVLLGLGTLVCIALPAASAIVLGTYFVLTLVYSFYLKRKMLVDVFTLSMLYTLRIVFGASSIGVKCSPWLLAFSLFIFLSLAFSKRCSELFAIREHKSAASGRAYFTWDLVSMTTFGIASSFTGVVVLAQYIHSDEVRLLYSHPAWLWGIVPLTLYWLSRVWLLAARGALNEDPVVFATTDRVTYGIAGLSIALLVIAAKSNLPIPGIGE